VTYYETGHFPELEDPARFRALLLNEELWSGLGPKETDARVEDVLRIDECCKNSTRDPTLGTVSIAEQWKPLTSHL
jgi:hypothetical protein